MNAMKTIKIGGVPEHFNLAWYLGLKNGDFKKAGINLRWKDYFGGTGEMCKALRDKEIDLAVILTEGITKDIIAGNPCKIVQVFVKSPLIWGIHVSHNSKYRTIEDLKGSKAAISRFGSGSHLMAYVNAKNNHWKLNSYLDFEIVQDLNGAVQSLTNKSSDYFMWEKFTTKPLVDNNTFRRIGECPSPWPCFVIAVRDEFLETNKDYLKTILDIINSITTQFKEIPDIDVRIAKRYSQQLNDVKQWLNITEWSQSTISETTMHTVQDQLFSLNIIPEKWKYEQLVASLNN